MTLSKSATRAAVIASAVALGVSAQAQAAGSPRLVGTWQVKSTITKHVVFPRDVGTSVTRPWVFTPQCGTGGCPTVLKRQRSDRTYVTTTLSPTTATQYKGVATYVSACFNAAGTLLTPKGYNTTETTVVNVTRSASGTATAFSGTLRLVFSPTPAGEAKDCRNDLIEARSVSIKRTR